MKFTNLKSITLTTYPGIGLKIVEELYKRGFQQIDLHHARGSFIGGPVRKGGLPVESEQEIVTCLVESERAEEAFALIHNLAGLDQPGTGFMFINAAGYSPKPAS